MADGQQMSLVKIGRSVLPPQIQIIDESRLIASLVNRLAPRIGDLEADPAARTALLRPFASAL